MLIKKSRKKCYIKVSARELISKIEHACVIFLIFDDFESEGYAVHIRNGSQYITDKAVRVSDFIDFILAQGMKFAWQGQTSLTETQLSIIKSRSDWEMEIDIELARRQRLILKPWGEEQHHVE